MAGPGVARFLVADEPRRFFGADVDTRGVSPLSFTGDQVCLALEGEEAGGVGLADGLVQRLASERSVRLFTMPPDSPAVSRGGKEAPFEWEHMGAIGTEVVWHEGPRFDARILGGDVIAASGDDLGAAVSGEVANAEAVGVALRAGTF